MSLSPTIEGISAVSLVTHDMARAVRFQLNKAIKNSRGTVMLRVTDLGMPLPTGGERKTSVA